MNDNIQLFNKPLKFWSTIAYQFLALILILFYFILRGLLGYPNIIEQFTQSLLYELIVKSFLTICALGWMIIAVTINLKVWMNNDDYKIKNPLFSNRKEGFKILILIVPIEIMVDLLYLFD